MLPVAAEKALHGTQTLGRNDKRCKPVRWQLQRVALRCKVQSQ